MKVYLVFINNGEEYEDNYEWLDNVYSTEDLAKARKKELKKKYKKSYYEHTFRIEVKTVIEK